MPGVVAELLTISNTGDAQLLASEAGREAIVSALAQAIGAYFTGSTPQG
jgi:N-acetylmuramoyl-L-alanine amidase